MVTTRSHDHDNEAHASGEAASGPASTSSAKGPAAAAHAGDKRTASEQHEEGDDEASAHEHKEGGGGVIKKHKSSHERKVVVMPDDSNKGGDDQADGGQHKLTTTSEEGKQEEGQDVKEEEATPAAGAATEPAKVEGESSGKEGATTGGGEGNAEEGQVPQHEPNPDPKRKHGILEKGHVYFLYRPKVEVEHPESLDDISKFHILLVPHQTKFHRLIAVGKKALPEASESTRPIWGEVLNVGEDLNALKEGLGSYTYETKTLGTRHQPGARVAGSGAYVLHAAENYPKDSANASAVYHTYLVYELAVPHQLGEVQHALHIHEEGGFTLQVKNPEAPSTNPAVRNKPESKQPKYPEELHKLFKTRFIPADPPALLDYPGAELLLIPSKHTPEQDTSRKAKEALDSEEKELESEINKQSNGGEAKKALKEMGLDGLIDGKALEGHWE
ncbi:hypothetical protein BMF94_5944 [Rhodotorula taiwanensis]|uniref:Uncharacterized protein n=1 Tax=Rhodotorula taiwanensis TaxID=741276 RepID=A0A2S5B2L4_9BASI|nr:hypothetical protein BMF94_5944 [Rhodotorula taiwanensis]